MCVWRWTLPSCGVEGKGRGVTKERRQKKAIEKKFSRFLKTYRDQTRLKCLQTVGVLMAVGEVLLTGGGGVSIPRDGRKEPLCRCSPALYKIYNIHALAHTIEIGAAWSISPDKNGCGTLLFESDCTGESPAKRKNSLFPTLFCHRHRTTLLSTPLLFAIRSYSDVWKCVFANNHETDVCVENFGVVNLTFSLGMITYRTAMILWWLKATLGIRYALPAVQTEMYVY